MKTLIALTGAVLLAATAAASAQGFSRESTVTGPAGNTIHRQGTVTPDGQGGWTRKGSVTGPAGNTATYQGGGSCSGGKCEYGSTRTTRGGGTFNRSGSFNRN